MNSPSRQCAADFDRQYLEAVRSHWWFRGRERIVRVVAEDLACDRLDGMIADVGCGPGGPVRSVFPEGRVLAIDMSTTLLEAYPATPLRVAGDATELPLRGNAVSAICAFDVLEHLDDDLAVLREWRRTLVPRGWLVLTVPAFQALWSRHDDANGHRRRFRGPGLRKLLTDAGFEVIRLTYFNTVLLPAIAAARMAQRVFQAKVSAREHGATTSLDFTFRFPAWIERGFEAAFRFEAWWLSYANLPVGVSLCVVARATDECRQPGVRER